MNESRVSALLVVPDGVTITPLDTMPVDVREAAGAQVDDYAISREGTRTRVKIVDHAAAQLLAAFREPRSIVDAIITFSRNCALDPEATLIEAYPKLNEFLRDGFLVPAVSSGAHGARPSLPTKTRVGAFEIVRRLYTMDNTEVYQARDATGRTAALKIAGTSGSSRLAANIEHETRVLSQLEGACSPAPLDSGWFESRCYIAMEWRAGVSPLVVARELHAHIGGADRQQLLALAIAIVEAYARLHELGVVHGDVHANNILVDRDGGVTLIDFGLARLLADPPVERPARGGVAEQFDPQLIRARLAGEPSPPATTHSDQYAVASLLFRLATLQSYLGTSLQEDVVFRRIVESDVPSFASCDVDPWPEMEAVLVRALAKEPAARFESMEEFAAHLRCVRVPALHTAVRQRASRLSEFEARVRSRLAIDGPLLQENAPVSPRASVNFGSAGRAWAVYRLACIHGNPELLALAEVWLHRANEEATLADAFLDPSIGITPALVGESSVFHSRAGVDCVHAAVSAARGDAFGYERAARDFVSHSSGISAGHDLVFGSGSVLLGGALLCEGAWSGAAMNLDAVRAHGDATSHTLARWMQLEPPIMEGAGMRNLGIAHGWAGVLYALLRWTLVQRTEVVDAVTERLEQLAMCAEPSGRGVRWRWIGHDQDAEEGTFVPGWCNGAAGFVHLWIAAYRGVPDERFLHLAESAAWETWEHPSRLRSLCCGLAGRAYALLAYHRLTGDPVWLERAAILAERAACGPAMADEIQFPDSLFKGEVGLAVLAADLTRPSESFMPLFEAEGWPRGGAVT